VIVEFSVMSYYTYITTNPKKTVFYTGVTNDLIRRMEEHRKSKGKWKTFAGRYFCHKLVYYEEFKTPMEAIKREKQIKELNRVDKIELIRSTNPKMHTLLV
jgi:putative endonuclease